MAAPQAKAVRIRRINGEVVQDCDVYVGRRITQGGWNLRQSSWANPFSVKEVGSASKAVEMYTQWLHTSKEGKALLSRIHELEGKRLGCWCDAPPCHAQVLADLANKHADGTELVLQHEVSPLQIHSIRDGQPVTITGVPVPPTEEWLVKGQKVRAFWHLPNNEVFRRWREADGWACNWTYHTLYPAGEKEVPLPPHA